MFLICPLIFVMLSPILTVAAIKVSSNCSIPLGMEDGRISDSQISASSSYQEDIVGAAKEDQLYYSS